MQSAKMLKRGMSKEHKPEQLKLQDDGLISFRADPTNPLPGVPVARLVRGDHALSPGFELLEGKQPVSKADLSTWFSFWRDQVLADLISLGRAEEDGIPAPAQSICLFLYEKMGIAEREALAAPIRDLTPEMRSMLRSRNVRLGPVLVFMPSLNKPAAIRLRAVLWSLAQDRPLPAAVPRDGAVSVPVEADKADPEFYRAIGYPLYGGRAIRIDMLDRVISAVYDSAQHGIFQARHEMAEWLGCTIDDLYAVLTAMGHKRIEDEPAAEDSAAKELSQTAVAPVKPSLAQFHLKRGKAAESENARPKRDNKPQRPKKEAPKPAKKSRPRDDAPRIISAEVARKPEDSPFAVLQKLKGDMSSS